MGRFFLGEHELRVVREERKDLLPARWHLVLEIPPGARSGPIEVETYGVRRRTGTTFRVESRPR